MKEIKYVIPKALYSEDIHSLRKRLKMTQMQFAAFSGVTKKTVERWEASEGAITGPITALYQILKEKPDIPEKLIIPEKQEPLRLFYMYRREICTIIDVNESRRIIRIYNFTNQPQYRAFGVNEDPDYEDYEEFLESRCFPRTRDKMKLQLKELELPFYDPLLIIQRTEGRMEEDEFWIRIER